MKKTYTNYSPGMRGITVNSDNGPYVHYLEPDGGSVDLDPALVIAVPDLGKAAPKAEADAGLADENADLRKQVADQAKEIDALKVENAELRKVPAAEPGPLDGSIPELTTHLATVTDADEVQKLLDAETAGKSRAGAIAVLEARRDELLA